MEPFRRALLDLGFTHVTSHGSSGNFIFLSPEVERGTLEERVAGAVGAEAFVRRRNELVELVAADPYVGREGSAVFLAKHPIDLDHARDMLALGFTGEVPVVSGSTVFFVHPVTRPGRKSILDFERELGVRGTMRSLGVIERVLQLMPADDSD